MPDAAPQRDAILAALERLLAWSEIVRSPQLGKFLDYIVRRTLDGGESSIKAYSIAVDVLGRGEDFDPQSDPIVRVQARRLRGLLDEYYQAEGAGETTQIRLPIGRYVPEFIDVAPRPGTTADTVAEPDAPHATPLQTRGMRLPWFALIVLALGSVLAVYSVLTWGQRQQIAAGLAGVIHRPSISVVEFQDLVGQGADAPAVAGLAIELVTDLEQFDDIDVRYGGGQAGLLMIEQPSSDYVLTGIVRLDGDVVQYSAILTESRSSGVVWNYTMPVPMEEAKQQDILDAVSRRLSLVLGSSRGPLHSAARQFLASGASLDGQINTYLCRIIFDAYRDSGSAADAEHASSCIAGLSEADRQDPVVLAMMASLTAERIGAADVDRMALQDRYHSAGASLERAIGLSPISGFVWEQQARLHVDMGELVMARADFGSSIQLNPANADALAAYAQLLALGGDLASARPLAIDAVNHAPDPPPWYQGVPTLMALHDGNYVDAIACAELFALADHELGPILAIMAGQAANDSAVVNRYLPQVLDVAAFRAVGVVPRLRQRISDEALIEAIRVALTTAGMPPSALSQAF